MQNERGQGISHATGGSIVPEKVQEQAPAGLEQKLPDSIHDTGSGTSQGSSFETHAKDGGNASKVPLGIQKAVPESIERILPNAIHDTGDQSVKK